VRRGAEGQELGRGDMWVGHRCTQARRGATTPLCTDLSSWVTRPRRLHSCRRSSARSGCMGVHPHSLQTPLAQPPTPAQGPQKPSHIAKFPSDCQPTRGISPDRPQAVSIDPRTRTGFPHELRRGLTYFAKFLRKNALIYEKHTLTSPPSAVLRLGL